jgi:tRNA threonylcarbamoyladenosine modification (KEOPS) complex  Pcc1 subunit
MATIRIAEYEDGLVLHFETLERRINAYTLASTLVNLADAAKAANRAVNAGYEIEILVEAFGSGSFRAKINAIYRSAENLFSAESLRAVILSVIASFIYEQIHPPQEPVKIVIQKDEVIIDQGKDQIIVPRNVYDATRDAAKNPQFVDSLNEAMQAVARDPKIAGFGLVPQLSSPTPEIIIPKAVLSTFEPAATPEPIERIIYEECDLQIVKAILERTERKWEFRWHGVKISAPVIDPTFYPRFFAHKITIAPGDELNVRLAIRQVREEDSRIYTNVGYEVVQVHVHRSKMQQISFEEANPSGESPVDASIKAKDRP